MLHSTAKFGIGQVVRHRKFSFRGVVFDIDAVFANSVEWWEAIPEDTRPSKEQPFYHLLAENESSYYVAYVSEQNLVEDQTGEPVEHPEVSAMFGHLNDGKYNTELQLN
jgi:heat shock protein HspQ